ncbi:MAG: hypothetical protein Q9220_006875 [cf. Caloplaca sp. 1 TL-2023]
MGNQVSSAKRKKHSERIDPAVSPSPAHLKASSPPPQQQQQHQKEKNPNPSAIQTRHLSKLRLTIPQSKSTAYPTPSPSTQTSGSITLGKQSTTGTDGASTPNEEKVETSVPPPPPLVTETDYISLPLYTASPSDASTITPGILDVPSSSTLSASVTALNPSLPSREESSSSTSSTQGISDRPLSSESLPSRPHPFAPMRHFRPLDKIPAPPLQRVHFACYQSHQKMVCSSNVNCPLPCMACGMEDEQNRWKCVWCCLRICAPCMDTLTKIKGRDLAGLVKVIDRKRNRSTKSTV